MESSGDATGRGKGKGREPDLTLVPGGGAGKRMFVEGGWSLEPLGHTRSRGGGALGFQQVEAENGDATERWNVLFGPLMLSSLPFIHSLILLFIPPTII